MKKKIGALLIACAMIGTVAVGFSGCRHAAAPDFEMPEGGFDVNKPVTITFYHSMGANLRNALDEHIAVFEKMYPNITVECTSQGDWDGVRDIIITELQGGNHPNLAYCYADHVADYNVSNAVLSLNDFLADGAYKDVTVPTVLVDVESGEYVDEEGNPSEEPVTVDRPISFTQEEEDMYNPIYFEEGYEFGDGSKMYTLPWAKSTEVIFYNKTFFDDNGLTPPTTWDEMETLCARIKEIDTDPAHVPFGYDSEENWFITMCEQQGSPYTSVSGDKFLFDTAENKEFVTRFKEWKDKGYFITSTLASTGTNTVYTSNLLLDGTLYMSIGSTGGTSYNLDLSGEKVPFEVGIAPVPQLDPEHPKMISQGPSVCIFKDEDPQKVLASWLFVKFMTTNPLYQTQVSMSNGYMPVLKQEIMNELPAYSEWVKKANGSTYLTAQAVKVGMEHESDYFVSPAFHGSSDARDQVGKIMQQVFGGTKTVDQAFKDALAYLNAQFSA